ncbi:MAG: hypothetical protein JOY61_12875 [Chloroflexi bacterium]|nr:hypothetical protein [Chloroflexota bacterium]
MGGGWKPSKRAQSAELDTSVPEERRIAEVLNLSGLDPDESRRLLRHQDLQGDDAAWLALTVRYGGNPLALKLAGATIRELFAGDITAYLADLELGPGAVFGSVRRLLEAQLQRVSPVEQHLICWFAVERERIGFSSLAESLGPTLSRRDLREALEALLGRSLLERTDAAEQPAFTLHPVVLTYVSEKIVEELAEEIAASEHGALAARPLIKATANEYVRANQERILAQPLLARLLARFGGDAAVQRRLVELLDVVRAVPLEEQVLARSAIVRRDRGPRRNPRAGGNTRRSACRVWRRRRRAAAVVCGYRLQPGRRDCQPRWSVGPRVRGDGRSIATGGVDGVLRLWSASDMTLDREFRADRRYERMDITGLAGITTAQRLALLALGALDRAMGSPTQLHR